MKKLIAVLAIVAVLATTLSGITMKVIYADDEPLPSHEGKALYNTDDFVPTKDKAMLFLPGLMASALYQVDSDEQTWGVEFFFEMIKDLSNEKANGTPESKKQFLADTVFSIGSDENNVPNVKYRVANMNDSAGYDCFGGMKYSYNIAKQTYGEQYDTLVWQYDWRQHNMGAAEQLEKFINKCNYKEVMFFTHSMGGIVIANYLARSEENRKKCKLFMPFGAPFLGSMDAISNLFESSVNTAANIDWENVNILDTVMEMLSGVDTGVSVFDFGLGLVNNWLGTDFALTQLARNIATVYELLPFPEYNSTQYFTNGNDDFIDRTASIYVNGIACDSKSFDEFIKGFSWARKANGKLMPVVKNLDDYRDNLYFEKDGKKVFVTELVPTEYVVGVGMKTSISCDITTEGQIKDTYTSMLGDGTVPAYSGTAGLPLTDERVHLVTGISHGPLLDGTAENPADKTGLQYLLPVLSKYIEHTDAELK